MVFAQMRVDPSTCPFRLRRTRRVGPPGGRQRLVEQGPPYGRPVVLLHGLASLAEEILYPLGEPLAAGGYRVVAIDRPGYGGSDAVKAADMGPAAQADGLLRTLNSLALRDVILIAHSAGAAPGLHLARRVGGPVAGLVLINPFCRPTRPKAALGLRAATAPVIGRPIRRLLPRMAPWLGRRMIRAGLHAEAPMPDLRAFPWHRMAQPTAVVAMADELNGFNADMTRFRSCLSSIMVPTLILADPDDPVIEGADHALWLDDRLPVSAVRWNRAGHMIHHLDPAAVIDAVASIEVATEMGLRRIS